MIDLALQIILVVLLLLTITWCVIVHHRLRRLRVDRGELQSFIAALAEATERAEAAVQRMYEANRAVEGSAREQARRTRQESEALARLVDNASRVIKRLDAAVENGATKLAELRSQPTLAPAVVPEDDARAASGRGRSPGTAASPLGQRGSAAGVSERSHAAAAAAAKRADGRLDGLLHGALREALQDLR